MSPSVRRFVGALMMSVGGLLAGLCGACTILFEGSFIFNELTRGTLPSTPDLLILPVALGVVPIMIGVALFLWGRWIRRRAALP